MYRTEVPTPAAVSRRCPKCGLFSTSDAVACECGHLFVESAAARSFTKRQRAERAQKALERSTVRGKAASAGSRFLGRVVDDVALGACIAGPMIGTIGSRSASVMNAAGIVGVVLYLVVQYQLFQTRGKTLGKLIAGIRVTRTDGTPAGIFRGWLARSFFLHVLSLLQVWPINGLLVLFGGRGIHDYVFDTVVVEG